jgi:hypothetical protein
MKNIAAPTQQYMTSRKQVEHVDSQSSQRIVWLVNAQAFFFGAFATLINGSASMPALEMVFGALIKILPITGLLTNIFTLVDVIAALKYMRKIRLKYQDALKSDVTLDAAYPILTGPKLQRRFMHVSPVFIPLLFAIVWTIVIVIQYNAPAASPALRP